MLMLPRDIRRASVQMSSEDDTWLFDSVMGFLKGPEWALPVMAFIDENCIVFDDSDENKLPYMEIYKAFVEMVECLLEHHLEVRVVSRHERHAGADLSHVIVP